MADSIPCALFVVRSDGTVTIANENACKLLAMNRGDVLGKDFASILLSAFGSRLQNKSEFLVWLEMMGPLSHISAAGQDHLSNFELEFASESEPERRLLISMRLAKIGEESFWIFCLQDLSRLRWVETRLELISDAAREVNSDLQVRRILPRLFEVISRKVRVDAMCLVSHTGLGKARVIAATPEGFLDDLISASAQVKLGGQSGELLVDFIGDIEKTLPEFQETTGVIPLEIIQGAHKAGMRSIIGVPLSVVGRSLGLWILASKVPGSFGHSDLEFLEPVAEHLSVAVNNALLLERTKEMYSAAVRALAATVDVCDTYTMNHSEHVAQIAKVIAEEMGFPKEEVEVIELAGLVHDIGKVGIPDSILNKPGPLDPEERIIMANHSVLGANILERAGMLSDLAPMVLHHHEWHNGQGYPDRLDGSSIPAGAAILSVADAFDTMVSDRVYRPAMGLEDAREELRRCAGKQFHPDVVAALERAIDKAVQRGDPWLKNTVGSRISGSRSISEAAASSTLAELMPVIDRTTTSKEMSVLFRIALEIKKVLDLNDLQEHVLNIVAEEMGYSDCVILLCDEKGQNLVISAGIGLSKDMIGVRIPEGVGISWWVMKHGQPQNVPDVTKDTRYYQGVEGIGSELYVPLEVRGKRLGVLLVQKREKGGFSSEDVRLLMAVAGHIASALEVAQLHEQVKRAADTDALTGLYNRRRFMEDVEWAIARAAERRGPSPISVVIVDIDSLKYCNDHFGHLAGDMVLCAIADRLKKGFRVCDTVARYGGDEFVVLLPGADTSAASQRIKSIVSSWKGEMLKLDDGSEVPLPSASFGVASYPDDGHEARTVLAVADNRLLKAKPYVHSRPC